MKEKMLTRLFVATSVIILAAFTPLFSFHNPFYDQVEGTDMTSDILGDPPNMPSNPNPANGTTNVSVSADLNWTGGDPDVGDTVTYDVYFGTISSPPKVTGNQTETSYNLSTLNYSTNYYWKIVAWDDHGASTSGLPWTFTTAPEENNPPETPRLDGPIAGSIDVKFSFSATTTDSDNDQVYYNYSWGDNTSSGWLGPFNSSSTIQAQHNWTAAGEYNITVIAKDIHNAESNRSEPLFINISRGKQIEINNIKPGFIYFRIFEGKSLIYIHLFEQLGVSIVFSLSLEINASTTEHVHLVKFNVTRLLTSKSVSFVDENTTNGVRCDFTNITSGLFSITASAYDTTGYEIDKQTLDYVAFIKI